MDWEEDDQDHPTTPLQGSLSKFDGLPMSDVFSASNSRSFKVANDLITKFW